MKLSQALFAYLFTAVFLPVEHHFIEARKHYVRGLGSGSGKGCTSKSKGSKGKGSKGKGSKGRKSKGSKEALAGGYCGCQSCTVDDLDKQVGAYTCGERMEFLLESYPDTFSTMQDACKRVAGTEFPQGT
jgi:hypothetical protein